MSDYAKLGRQSLFALSQLSAEKKNTILLAMADGLRASRNTIIEANALDLEQARAAGLSSALLDRLQLNEEKILLMAKGIQEVIHLPDPCTEVIESFTSPDGLFIKKVRVPLGLLLMIYESRPNVTADAAALAIKSGNAIILKGGKESIHTNSAIADALIPAAEGAGLPKGAIQLIRNSDRSITDALLQNPEAIDAVIPRGGKRLKAAIAATAKVPVLMTGSGLCHMYVAATADPEQAEAIVLNAKTQRPGVCNAIETLLIDDDYTESVSLLKALLRAGVSLRLSEDLFESFSDRLIRHCVKNNLTADVTLATEADWEEEYLDLILAVKTVKNVKEACAHIRQYSSGHSEAILTYDDAEAEYFLNAVDAACVYHNASTRFTDGGCFGFGCEIGISTQKLHARGPMGLRELTSYKYVIVGSGDVRR